MLFRGSFLYKWCLGAAHQLQQKSVHRILYAPLGFFLQVWLPVGLAAEGAWVVEAGWFLGGRLAGSRRRERHPTQLTSSVTL